MKKALPLLVLALAALALVACGSDNGTTTTEAETEASSGAAAGESEAGGESGGEAGGAGSTVNIEADPGGQLAYTQKEVTAKAGNVTIDFSNPQPIGHDVVVETEGGEELGGTEIITEGSSTVSLKGLKPGKYTFFCSVPGHREAGMEGTLVVE
ncbi:MAG TPA: plastocyanin/azurin family copper-binding protein [Solirubrobacterales bacterium]|jgi:plastocyanin